ncbi:hypothetical protein P4C99_22075, partial [Pontiellaceae bacterium B1224]|nr:hypothetical protein [Pontiellaceae bacterium B1224]
MKDLHKSLFKQCPIRAAEGTDGVVIRMQITAADITHYDIRPGGVLNYAGGEASGGVTVDKQGEHHARWVLFIARSATIEAEVISGQPIYRINQKMHDMVIRNPITKIR